MFINALIFAIVECFLIKFVYSNVLGCGGFIKSHVPMDFSKVEVQLFTKTGILKDTTTCAPNNGYYFIPLYDKAEYILKLQPPPGWSFTPTEVNLDVGVGDPCSKEQDINFIFEGFGITGRVESFSSSSHGPTGVTVELKSNSETRTTITKSDGHFFFTPVYPGNYTVTAKHPKWTFSKNSVFVNVIEGNTELPAGSLVVLGYDVTGMVKCDGKPVKDVDVVLFITDKEKQAHITGCDKTPIPNLVQEKNRYQVCHVKTNEEGKYVFPSLINGVYSVIAVYLSQNVHFDPDSITFTVDHDSLTIARSFNIVGISVSGRILNARNGVGIPSAPIMLDGEKITSSDKGGRYILKNIKIGKHKIRSFAENMEFDEKTIDIQPTLPNIPDIFPLKYQVCGAVLSDHPQSISIFHIGTTDFFQINTDNLGKFCQYLKAGKYEFKVQVKDEVSSSSVQFFPAMYPVEVTNMPLNDIVFSQLKAKISGQVDCIRDSDCENLQITMKSSNEETVSFTANVTNNSYEFIDVRPGRYDLALSSNKMCWNTKTQTLTVSSAHEKVPSFKQTGYKIIFVSTHDTLTSYKLLEQNVKESQLEIAQGRNSYCLEKPGKYRFTFQSCHIFEEEYVDFDTDSPNDVVYITAMKHQISVSIQSNEPESQVFATVNINGKKVQTGPLPFSNGLYTLNLHLTPSESAIVVPESETLFFNPPILSINGEEDCSDTGIRFTAVKGKVFKGKVTPPLAKVLVTIETEKTGEALMVETDEKGYYRFQPLDDSKTYRVSAKKESYVLIGPDNNNNFVARKLAEVMVFVKDNNNQPLQGTLLSLSGGHSYRSNLQTDEEGKITFYSLSPGDYFLRPVMKEYSFEPNSKMIEVKEGATVVVELKAKRIAFSGYGMVTSLNGEPEEFMTILAKGIGNCSKYSEETNTETSGIFRIRGLQPFCDYEVTIKGSLDPSSPIERALPEALQVSTGNQDIADLKFKVIRKHQNMDVVVHVYVENPEVYKSLRVKLQRESSPSGLIHTVKLDAATCKYMKENNPGVLLQLPSILWDDRSYSVQLESSIPTHSVYKPKIEYFTANSSFKYVSLRLATKDGPGDQQIKQTSVWTLLFVCGCFILLYFIDNPLSYLNELLIKLNIGNFANNTTLFKVKSAQTEVVDTQDIDQIVQSINATKRKIKSRRA